MAAELLSSLENPSLVINNYKWLKLLIEVPSHLTTSTNAMKKPNAIQTVSPSISSFPSVAETSRFSTCSAE